MRHRKLAQQPISSQPILFVSAADSDSFTCLSHVAKMLAAQHSVQSDCFTNYTELVTLLPNHLGSVCT